MKSKGNKLAGQPKTPKIKHGATTSGCMRASAGEKGRAQDPAWKKYSKKRTNP